MAVAHTNKRRVASLTCQAVAVGMEAADGKDVLASFLGARGAPNRGPGEQRGLGRRMTRWVTTVHTCEARAYVVWGGGGLPFGEPVV
jgi:hypothetical protein